MAKFSIREGPMACWSAMTAYHWSIDLCALRCLIAKLESEVELDYKRPIIVLLDVAERSGAKDYSYNFIKDLFHKGL